MNEPGIYKTDLLEKLNEIYTQLEELETVLHSSYLKQQKEIQKLQKNGLDVVEERLAHFESEIDKLTAAKHMNKKKTVIRKLELGIESM